MGVGLVHSCRQSLRWRILLPIWGGMLLMVVLLSMLSSNLLMSLVVSACLMVVSMFGTYHLVDEVLMTLTTIHAGMRRVMDGHLEHRIGMGLDDELGQLAEQFNLMAERVQQSQEETRRHADLLERRVGQRTMELQAAYEDLQSLDRAKDCFLSSLSHEMRTPLTSIIASEEILSDYADEDPLLREEFLSVIQRESQNLLATIGQLLDVAKLEARALELNLSRVDLVALVSEVVEPLQSQAKKRGITWVTTLPSKPAWCCCDHDRIVRVLQTLVTNALRFSQPGQAVDVQLSPEQEGFAISVRDQASVSDEDDRLEAARCVQDSSSILANTSSGFAYGLPISTLLVKAHGGKLAAQRTEENDNIFRLWLPKSPVREASSASQATDLEGNAETEEAGWKPAP